MIRDTQSNPAAPILSNQSQKGTFYQQVARLQARCREQELRSQALQESERELAAERAALAEEYRKLHQILQQLSRCAECQAPSSPLIQGQAITPSDQVDVDELARLTRENKRLRLALDELERLLQSAENY